MITGEARLDNRSVRARYSSDRSRLNAAVSPPLLHIGLSLARQLIEQAVALALGVAHGVAAMPFQLIAVDLSHLGGLEDRLQVLHGQGALAGCAACIQDHLGAVGVERVKTQRLEERRLA